MLYKKIHRQYLREFRKGRKFKYTHNPDITIIKLYIKDGSVWVNRNYDGDVLLISLDNPAKGIIRDKNLIEWLK